jgi:hypothetical protein
MAEPPRRLGRTLLPHGGDRYINLMNPRELRKRRSAILDAHGTGLLATTDADGAPHVR